MERDLFGEIIVTESDLRAWVAAVSPAWTSSDRSFHHYVKNWNVADKVRRAKEGGYFQDTIAAAHDRHTALARRFGVHIPETQ
jgi:hypothetical protein